MLAALLVLAVPLVLAVLLVLAVPLVLAALLVLAAPLVLAVLNGHLRVGHHRTSLLSRLKFVELKQSWRLLFWALDQFEVQNAVRVIF